MKKAFLFVFILSFWVFTAHGAALKIGYIDLDKAISESNEWEKAKKTLEDMRRTKQTLIDEKGNEIKKLEEELEKQASILTPKSIEDKQDHLKKVYRDYQRMAKDFQEELQKKEAGFIQEIQKDLVEVVNKIAKEEDYTIIFERRISGILYSRKEIDITEKVIKDYNEITKAE